MQLLVHDFLSCGSAFQIWDHVFTCKHDVKIFKLDLRHDICKFNGQRVPKHTRNPMCDLELRASLILNYIRIIRQVRQVSKYSYHHLLSLICVFYTLLETLLRGSSEIPSKDSCNMKSQP